MSVQFFTLPTTTTGTTSDDALANLRNRIAVDRFDNSVLSDNVSGLTTTTSYSFSANATSTNNNITGDGTGPTITLNCNGVSLTGTLPSAGTLRIGPHRHVQYTSFTVLTTTSYRFELVNYLLPTWAPGDPITFSTPGTTVAGTYTVPTGSADIVLADGQHLEPTTTGNYVFVDREITLNGSSTIRANIPGIHLYFINCVIVQNGIGQGSTDISPQPRVGLGPINRTTTGADVSLGRTNSKSVNYYGSYYQADVPERNFLTVSDGFDSKFESTNGGFIFGSQRVNEGLVLDQQPNGGSRFLNVTGTVLNANDDEASMRSFSPLHIAEGIVLDGMSNLMTAVGRAQTTVREPQFQNPNRSQKWRFQFNSSVSGDDNAENAMYQVIGYPIGPSNNFNQMYQDDSSQTSFISARDQSGINGGRPQSGLMNFYSWLPEYYSDSAMTNGIPNVRVRTESNLALSSSNLTSPSFATVRTAIANQTGVGTAADFTGRDLNHINDFLTDSSGKITTTGAQWSSDGTTPDNAGYIDWLKLGTATSTSATGTNAARFIHENWSGNILREGEIVVPTLNARQDRVEFYAGKRQARCASHLVSENEDVVTSRIGSGTGEHPAGANVSTRDFSAIALPRPGWITDRTEATALAGFSALGSKTPQEIFDLSIANWSRYGTNISEISTDSGMADFIALDLVLDSTDSATTYEQNTTGDVTVRRINGLTAPLSTDLISGIKTTGNVQLPANATINFNIESNNINYGSATPPTKLIDGATVNGTLAIVGNNTSYTIENADLENLTIIKSGTDSDNVNVNCLNCTNFSSLNQNDANVTAQEVFTNTITIPTPEAGFYAVRSTINDVNSETTAPVAFTKGQDLSISLSGTTYITNTTRTDKVDVYVKYNSNFATGSVQYYTERTESFDFENSNSARTFSSAAAEVSGALTDQQANLPSTVTYPTTGTNPFTQASDNNGVTTVAANNTELLVSINYTGGATLPFGQSMQLAARIANEQLYFQSWYNNAIRTTNPISTPIITYSQGYVSAIDNTRITFASGNTVTNSDGTFRTPHTLTNWQSNGTDTFSLNRTGAFEVAFVTAGLALVNPADISTAISGSAGIMSITNTVDSIANDVDTIEASVGTTLATDLGTVSTNVTGIQTDLSNSTDGLGAIKTSVDGIQTDLSNSTDGLGVIQSTASSIQTSITDATNGLESIKDTIDAVQVDLSNSTDGLGAIKTSVDAVQTDLDNSTDGLGAIKTSVDGVQTDLDNSTDGLGAIKTTADGIQTDLDNTTDGLGAIKADTDYTSDNLRDVSILKPIPAKT